MMEAPYASFNKKLADLLSSPLITGCVASWKVCLSEGGGPFWSTRSERDGLEKAYARLSRIILERLALGICASMGLGNEQQLHWRKLAAPLTRSLLLQATDLSKMSSFTHEQLIKSGLPKRLWMHGNEKEIEG